MILLCDKEKMDREIIVQINGFRKSATLLDDSCIRIDREVKNPTETKWLILDSNFIFKDEFDAMNKLFERENKMSKIEELRKTTKKASKELKVEQETNYENFGNSNLFKTILSDFEESALVAAKKGEHIAFIRTDKYFNHDTVQNGQDMIRRNIEKLGYRCVSITKAGTYAIGCSWR